MKLFNKWTRKIHRWLAVPTAILIPTAIVLKLAGGAGGLPPQLEQFQSIMMLTLAITGAYLFLIPYIAKWQRNQRQKAKAAVRK